jgi:phosphatidylglycerol lysyltransferase
MTGIDAARERPEHRHPLPSHPDPTQRVLQHLAQFGRTATAFRAVGPDLSVWEPPGLEAVIAYATPAGALVSAGEPIAALDELIPAAEAFLAHARAQRKRASFFATEGRLAESPALQRLLLGEQPVWDPQGWSAHVSSHRSFREQVRRARAKGVSVHRISQSSMERGPVADAVQTLIARWRATRSMATMRFLVTVDLISGGAARRHLAAWQDGQLVALLSLAPVPERNGWVFEHLLRDPDAPNGTLELLVDHAMRELAGEGVSWATLGLAPLHGDVAPWLRRLRHWSTPLFNFEGLAAFKRKLRPSYWEPIYLAWPVREAGWRALRDGLRAFAGGSLLRFAVRTALRGPRPLLLALEWLLVPWTIALALAPTEAWFPSVAVQAAWVAFDGALLLALRHVRRASARQGTRERRGVAHVATAVAVAVTFDAVLTAWQAIIWNAPRLSTTAEWCVLLLAGAGPCIAAPVLWGAARRLHIVATPRPRVDSLQFST